MSAPRPKRLGADIRFAGCEGYFIQLSANDCFGEIARITQDRQPTMKAMTLNPLSSNLIDSV